MSGEKQYMIPGGVNILEYLQSKGIFISAPCGGHGTCGKCKIRLVAGVLPVSDIDRALLTTEETDAGLRLACRAKPLSPVRIAVREIIHKSGCVSFTQNDNTGNTRSENTGSTYNNDKRYAVAIDLGTTTLAAALVDLDAKKVIRTVTSLNRQSIFGADVMTRMESALSGKAEDMKRIIESDLLDLVAGFGFPKGTDISEMVIAGNTVMYHLLMEWDVSGLSEYPFTPVSTGGEELKRDEVFVYETSKRNILPPECRVRLVKGFGAFVGGDIASGLIACDIFTAGENVFFIDIGTNAEMVLKKGDTLHLASAAAGPALEGGNLKCGTGSVPGAICGVEIVQPVGFLKIKTINDEQPAGLCGTGAIEAVYELRKAGIINGYGTFTEAYLEKGFTLARDVSGMSVIIDQEDVRQIQMAKAAICAAAQVLMKKAGLAAGEIDRVIVSGNFGSFLDMHKAGAIGLLPPELADKAEASGNTSLDGAVKCLESEAVSGVSMGDCSRLTYMTHDLSTDEDFKELYIECMNI